MSTYSTRGAGSETSAGDLSLNGSKVAWVRLQNVVMGWTTHRPTERDRAWWLSKPSTWRAEAPLPEVG